LSCFIALVGGTEYARPAPDCRHGRNQDGATVGGLEAGRNPTAGEGNARARGSQRTDLLEYERSDAQQCFGLGAGARSLPATGAHSRLGLARFSLTRYSEGGNQARSQPSGTPLGTCEGRQDGVLCAPDQTRQGMADAGAAPDPTMLRLSTPVAGGP